jgi:hypothetical protein
VKNKENSFLSQFCAKNKEIIGENLKKCKDFDTKIRRKLEKSTAYRYIKNSLDLPQRRVNGRVGHVFRVAPRHVDDTDVDNQRCEEAFPVETVPDGFEQASAIRQL